VAQKGVIPAARFFFFTRENIDPTASFALDDKAVVPFGLYKRVTLGANTFEVIGALRDLCHRQNLTPALRHCQPVGHRLYSGHARNRYHRNLHGTQSPATVSVVSRCQGRQSIQSQEIEGESSQGKIRGEHKVEGPPGCRGDEVVPGYSAECVSGHHESCTERDCRCLCAAHPWNQTLMKGAPRPAPANGSGGTLVCPNCDRIPRAGDFFCRADGIRLIAGKMCRCGHAAEPDDKYCGNCGLSFAAPIVPVPELSESEIAALEARARQRPSDVEVPPTEVQ
jgi:hypothetical protein